ncbi:Breast cancer 2, early onset [Gonapodya sp. JEL0774]|nr:Breast cancer 2, early onset [Gonapodya sp. JEL0774]
MRRLKLVPTTYIRMIGSDEGHDGDFEENFIESTQHYRMRPPPSRAPRVSVGGGEGTAAITGQPAMTGEPNGSILATPVMNRRRAIAGSSVSAPNSVRCPGLVGWSRAFESSPSMETGSTSRNCDGEDAELTAEAVMKTLREQARAQIRPLDPTTSIDRPGAAVVSIYVQNTSSEGGRSAHRVNRNIDFADSPLLGLVPPISSAIGWRTGYPLFGDLSSLPNDETPFPAASTVIERHNLGSADSSPSSTTSLNTSRRLKLDQTPASDANFTRGVARDAQPSCGVTTLQQGEGGEDGPLDQTQSLEASHENTRSPPVDLIPEFNAVRRNIGKRGGRTKVNLADDPPQRSLSSAHLSDKTAQAAGCHSGPKVSRSPPSPSVPTSRKMLRHVRNPPSTPTSRPERPHDLAARTHANRVRDVAPAPSFAPPPPPPLVLQHNIPDPQRTRISRPSRARSPSTRERLNSYQRLASLPAIQSGATTPKMRRQRNGRAALGREANGDISVNRRRIEGGQAVGIRARERERESGRRSLTAINSLRSPTHFDIPLPQDTQPLQASPALSPKGSKTTLNRRLLSSDTSSENGDEPTNRDFHVQTVAQTRYRQSPRQRIHEDVCYSLAASHGSSSPRAWVEEVSQFSSKRSSSDFGDGDLSDDGRKRRRLSNLKGRRNDPIPDVETHATVPPLEPCLSKERTASVFEHDLKKHVVEIEEGGGLLFQSQESIDLLASSHPITIFPASTDAKLYGHSSFVGMASSSQPNHTPSTTLQLDGIAAQVEEHSDVQGQRTFELSAQSLVRGPSAISSASHTDAKQVSTTTIQQNAHVSEKPSLRSPHDTEYSEQKSRSWDEEDACSLESTGAQIQSLCGFLDFAALEVPVKFGDETSLDASNAFHAEDLLGECGGSQRILSEWSEVTPRVTAANSGPNAVERSTSLSFHRDGDLLPTIMEDDIVWSQPASKSVKASNLSTSFLVTASSAFQSVSLTKQSPLSDIEEIDLYSQEEKPCLASVEEVVRSRGQVISQTAEGIEEDGSFLELKNGNDETATKVKPASSSASQMLERKCEDAPSFRERISEENASPPETPASLKSSSIAFTSTHLTAAKGFQPILSRRGLREIGVNGKVISHLEGPKLSGLSRTPFVKMGLSKTKRPGEDSPQNGSLKRASGPPNNLRKKGLGDLFDDMASPNRLGAFSSPKGVGDARPKRDSAKFLQELLEDIGDEYVPLAQIEMTIPGFTSARKLPAESAGTPRPGFHPINISKSNFQDAKVHEDDSDVTNEEHGRVATTHLPFTGFATARKSMENTGGFKAPSFSRGNRVLQSETQRFNPQYFHDAQNQPPRGPQTQVSGFSTAGGSPAKPISFESRKFVDSFFGESGERTLRGSSIMQTSGSCMVQLFSEGAVPGPQQDCPPETALGSSFVTAAGSPVRRPSEASHREMVQLFGNGMSKTSQLPVVGSPRKPLQHPSVLDYAPPVSSPLRPIDLNVAKPSPLSLTRKKVLPVPEMELAIAHVGTLETRYEPPGDPVESLFSTGGGIPLKRVSDPLCLGGNTLPIERLPDHSFRRARRPKFELADDDPVGNSRRQIGPSLFATAGGSPVKPAFADTVRSVSVLLDGDNRGRGSQTPSARLNTSAIYYRRTSRRFVPPTVIDQKALQLSAEVVLKSSRNPPLPIFDNSFDPKRSTIREQFGLPCPYSGDALLASGLPWDLCCLTSESASGTRYETASGQLWGVKEAHRALLEAGALETVATLRWVRNHYRWITWKLASIVRSYHQEHPDVFLRYWSENMVLDQLKYRYELEVNQCKRSALKLIIEGDDSSTRHMVVVVKVLHISVFAEASLTELKLELTDGWYAISATLDGPLTLAVQRGRIFVGQKLVIAGAHMTTKEAKAALDVSDDMSLKLQANSTRRARWDAKLGLQKSPSMLTSARLAHPQGGFISSIDVVILRKYPLLFMEKCTDGGGGGERTLIRNEEDEEDEQRRFEQTSKIAVERAIAAVEEAERSEGQVNRRASKVVALIQKQFPESVGKILIQTFVAALTSIDDPEELFEEMQKSADDASFFQKLSHSQQISLDQYRECRAAELRTRREQEIAEKVREFAPERKVTPLLKLRVVDYRRPTIAGGIRQEVLLTYWRPDHEMVRQIQEGRRYRFTGLRPSKFSKNRMPNLDASRESRISPELPISQIRLEELGFAPRKWRSCDDIDDLNYRDEADIVGIFAGMSLNAGGNECLFLLTDSTAKFVTVVTYINRSIERLSQIELGTLIALRNLKFLGHYGGKAQLKFEDFSELKTSPTPDLRERFGELDSDVQGWDDLRQDAVGKLKTLSDNGTRVGSIGPRDDLSCKNISQQPSTNDQSYDNALGVGYYNLGGASVSDMAKGIFATTTNASGPDAARAAKHDVVDEMDDTFVLDNFGPDDEVENVLLFHNIDEPTVTTPVRSSGMDDVFDGSFDEVLGMLNTQNGYGYL